MLQISPPCHTVKATRKPRSKPEPISSTPTVISGRRARGLVRKAKYVAVFVCTGRHGACDLVDVPKSRVLRVLKGRDECWVSELFGTIVVGMPSPI
jgi:hypothetical protein